LVPTASVFFSVQSSRSHTWIVPLVSQVISSSPPAANTAPPTGPPWISRRHGPFRLSAATTGGGGAVAGSTFTARQSAFSAMTLPPWSTPKPHQA
jgi:hypothetical protein